MDLSQTGAFFLTEIDKLSKRQSLSKSMNEWLHPSKKWDVITYPCPNFKVGLSEVKAWIIDDIHRDLYVAITYPRPNRDADSAKVC